MDIEIIKQRIEMIYAISSDYERAHGMEDDLMNEFIEFISSSDSKYADMAKEVLKVNNIDFSRSCS